ncbi:MAG: biotin/lipoyl-binding protein [Patescibacteria group bacterium]|nr:biotin/lipoyl-binding protein [Patescibacteria group bacterium]
MASGKIKKRYIIGIAIVLLIAAAGLARVFWFSEKAAEYDTVRVYRGNLIQTVDATGTVKALAEVQLSFESSGTLASTTVEVGDTVEKGQVLAELDNKELQYQLDQAKATLDLAQANLNLKIVGESSQSVQVSSADVAKAEASLRSAEVALSKARQDLTNAKTTTGDSVDTSGLTLAAAENTLAIRQATYDNTLAQSVENENDAYEDTVVILKDALSSMATSLSDMDNTLAVDDTSANELFKRYLSVLNSEALTTAQNDYRDAKVEKLAAYNAVNPLTTSSEQAAIWDAVSVTEDALNEVHQALSATRLVLDNTITGSDLTLTALNTKKTTIDTDLSAVNAQLTSLLTQKQTIQNLETSNTASLKSAELYLTAARDAYDQAVKDLESSQNSASTSIDAYESAVDSASASRDIQKAALDAAKAALSLKTADPRAVDLAPLQAQVKNAEAAYNLSLNRFEKSRIVAPSRGLITKINFEVGEQVSAAAVGGVIEMLSTDIFEVNVDISETDIVKINVNDSAEITLDAYGDETVFSGEVSEIDPAETVIQDVVYYRVKINIHFTAEQAVKNGMTADVVIKTDERTGVLIIPQRSVITKDGRKIIRVKKGDSFEEREPVIGLRGDGGLVELLSGAAESDEIIIAVKE